MLFENDCSLNKAISSKISETGVLENNDLKTDITESKDSFQFPSLEIESVLAIVEENDNAIDTSLGSSEGDLKISSEIEIAADADSMISSEKDTELKISSENEVAADTVVNTSSETEVAADTDLNASSEKEVTANTDLNTSSENEVSADTNPNTSSGNDVATDTDLIKNSENEVAADSDPNTSSEKVDSEDDTDDIVFPSGDDIAPLLSLDINADNKDQPESQDESEPKSDSDQIIIFENDEDESYDEYAPEVDWVDKDSFDADLESKLTRQTSVGLQEMVSQEP